MDSNSLQSILTRSRNLISKDMDGTLDNIAREERERINEMMDETPAVLTEGGSPVSNQVPKNPTREFNTSHMGPLADKLPREIVESFKKNPIEINGSGSILDSVSLPQMQKPKRQAKQQVIREVAAPQASAPIDYSMVKMIVEGVVKKEMEGIKESLNLGGNEISAMFNTKGGFKFLTKNGDIYEAKLIKKGNLNEAKKQRLDS